MPQIDQYLELAQKSGSSDLHLVSNEVPIARVDGVITKLEGAVISADQLLAMIHEIVPEHIKKTFANHEDIDYSYHTVNGRFRINCLWERGVPGLVARVIPANIPSLEDLGMPDILKQMVARESGLILFTGSTGSGKSTNLAAVIEYINSTSPSHIITLEDPIEFLYTPKKSVIRQREVGGDIASFNSALRYVVRQDPDVVVVGELRDLETIASAVTIAETGHLVIGTLHTPSASQTIDRIVDSFPPYQQEQIRLQLSMTLIGVVAQRLVPRVGGGRLAAREILLSTPAVANLIREKKVPQLRMVIETSSQEGMFTMDQDLRRLLQEQLISKQTYDAHKSTQTG